MSALKTQKGSSRNSRRFLQLTISLVLAFVALENVLAASDRPGLSFGESQGFSPHWDWRRIETEHFRINFPAELAEIAQRAANYFEEAHAALSPILRWEPRTRAEIVLVDNADLANGLASPVLRLGIVLITTPPDAWFSTNYYDDWLKLVIVHEYTHFLSMDATRNLWHPLRSVFGDVLLPNAIWPSWMLEGMAVYMETLLTRAGRGRSAYYDMVLRSAVQAGVFGTSDFVTLDKINGPNPYFPAGETAYLFGYEMMNRLASSLPGPLGGEVLLGGLAEQSSERVPFFLNKNVKDLTGRDWYGYWNDWTRDTTQRLEYQLMRIRSLPETRVERLTENAYQVLGSAVSPDGKWLAFSMDAYDRRNGLYLRNVETGEVTRLTDKRAGAQLCFTPDSRRILFSSVEEQSIYTQFSDLAYYDLDDKRAVSLSHSLRARDPDVAPDGKSVAFTLTPPGKATTGLAIAELLEDEGGLRLGEPRTLYLPEPLGRVTNPRFSRDGQKIVFSLQSNGSPGNQLAELNVASGAVTILVSDGRQNRFPAVSPAGELFFVSDATGVDNVYRYVPGQSELMTNVTTAAHFPTFAPDGSLYASVYSHTGSDLARLELSEEPIDREAVSIEPPPAPSSTVLPSREPVPYPVGDYSAIPSIWPRQWFPVVYLAPREVYLGAQVLGFDAVDRHRYTLGIGYNTRVSKPDLLVTYANRSLGPTFTLSAEQSTPDVLVREPLVNYLRKRRLSLVASYPVQRTYWTLLPAVAIELERSNEYLREPGFADSVIYENPYVPHLDLRLAFSNARTSRLAVGGEGGRELFAGTRTYFHREQTIWKALLMDREFFHLGDHVVWSPSAKLTWTSHFLSAYLPANALVRGRALRLTDPVPSDNFDQLALRGHPKKPFYARAAGVFGQEILFPVARIFRGWGTNPAFIDQISGFLFSEAAYFPLGQSRSVTLPAAGAGLKLNGEVFVQLPFQTTLEYHRGFRTQYGGESEVFLTFALGGFSF